MKINITKTNESAVTPNKANKHDAGFDCFANSLKETDNYLEYGLGFNVEIPDGFFGMLVARSSITNFDLMVKNSVGIIDSGYRGEVKLRTKKFGENVYKIGDKICQLIILPLPDVTLRVVDALDMSNDRKGGFGSTDLVLKDTQSEKMFKTGEANNANGKKHKGANK